MGSDHGRVSRDRHAFAEAVVNLPVARGELGFQRPRAARASLVYIRRSSILVFRAGSDYGPVSRDRHASAEFVVSLFAGEFDDLGPRAVRSPLEYVGRPPVVAAILPVRPPRSDYGPVSRDRHAVAELVARKPVARGELGRLRPCAARASLEYHGEARDGSQVDVEISRRSRYHPVVRHRHSPAQPVSVFRRSAVEVGQPGLVRQRDRRRRPGRRERGAEEQSESRQKFFRVKVPDFHP